jgi:hypothetical protein
MFSTKYLAAGIFLAGLVSTLQGSPLAVSTDGGVWEIRNPKSQLSVLRSRVGFEMDGMWIYSTDYPRHEERQAAFHNEVGSGSEITVRHSGRAGVPDLVLTLKSYDDLPWTSIMVQVKNTTDHEVRVSRFRMFETNANGLGRLTGSTEGLRVLSDSYSEDTPIVKIRDFTDAPKGMHLAVGTQLLYSRKSEQSFFAGALSSRRWLTVFHLSGDSYTADDEGTTELTETKSLSAVRPQDHVTLRVAVERGGVLASEELVIAQSANYLDVLRSYGEAVRRMNQARVSAEAPWGWWSFTAFYDGVAAGLVDTNADWVARHLRDAGYDYIHIDEGYAYARGEYTTPDPIRFPSGMEALARRITRRGLRLGVWTAPFEVSERSLIYEHHKDWLVKNEQGEPIWLGKMKGIDNLYALDVTNPSAREYLRQTYWTMAHVWGAGYIKLDFMEASAVEGVYYRPNTSAIEAERMGLKTIREAVGDGVIIDKDGSPMLAPVGLVDAGRISNDTEHSYQGTFDAASGIAARFYMNRNFYIADPDVFCVSNRRSPDPAWDELKPVSLEEAKAAITLSAMAGGMFENGDDLPGLGQEPDRLALLTNPDLLTLMRLGHAATPIDLMSYAPKDLQPSRFWVRESARQGLLAIFNWTESAKTREIDLRRLGLAGSGWKIAEAFAADGVTMAGGSIRVAQPAHSVRLIRLVDENAAVHAPAIAIRADEKAGVGQPIQFQVSAQGDDNPLLRYRWDFGDGTGSDAEHPEHTYTYAGSYAVTVTAETVDGPKAKTERTVEVRGVLNTRFAPSKSRTEKRAPMQ